MNIFKSIKSWFSPKISVNKPEIVDILGNELHEGDFIVRVKYNDKRSNYITIPINYDVLTYNKKINYKVLSYDAFLCANKATGRKHGYFHVNR